MESLSSAERELVAIGAALGSSCTPCVEYHISEAQKAGLNDRLISEAIHVADTIRQVPARKALAAALGRLPAADADTPAGNGGTDSTQHVRDDRTEPPCCG